MKPPSATGATCAGLPHLHPSSTFGPRHLGMARLPRRIALANAEDLMPPRPDRPAIDLCIPVLNEAHCIERSIKQLLGHIEGQERYKWTITVADNGSTDGTWELVQQLAVSEPRLRPLHLDIRGRGRALKAAWSTASADAVAYMDVDLSTDLEALTPLLESVVSGAADVAIGSRLTRGARTQRGFRREFVSRTYNAIARALFRYGIQDAQCGFKALSSNAASLLLPTVQDDSWFFDTELLVRARHAGLSVLELPVHWTEDTDSRVNITQTALDDLRGMWRLRTFWHRPPH